MSDERSRKVVGPVLDRLGRQGIGVEVTEPAALGPAADAEVPDFVGLRTWVATGRVDSTDVRP